MNSLSQICQSYSISASEKSFKTEILKSSSSRTNKNSFTNLKECKWKHFVESVEEYKWKCELSLSKISLVLIVAQL